MRRWTGVLVAGVLSTAALTACTGGGGINIPTNIPTTIPTSITVTLPTATTQTQTLTQTTTEDVPLIFSPAFQCE